MSRLELAHTLVTIGLGSALITGVIGYLLGWFWDDSVQWIGEEIGMPADHRHINCTTSVEHPNPHIHRELPWQPGLIEQAPKGYIQAARVHAAMFNEYPEYTPLVGILDVECCEKSNIKYWTTGAIGDYYTIFWVNQSAPAAQNDKGGFIYKWHCRNPRRTGLPVPCTMGRNEQQSWPDHYHGYFSKPQSARAIIVPAGQSLMTQLPAVRNGGAHWYRPYRGRYFNYRAYLIAYTNPDNSQNVDG